MMANRLRAVHEIDVENYARNLIREAGGRMWKWVSPGTRGIPDDIALWPCGIKDLLEFKRPVGGVYSACQLRVLEEIEKLGSEVFRLHTVEQVDMYVHYRRHGRPYSARHSA